MIPARPTLDQLHFDLALAARHAFNQLGAKQLHHVEPISREMAALQSGKVDTGKLKRLIEQLQPLMVTDEAKRCFEALAAARVQLTVWTVLP